MQALGQSLLARLLALNVADVIGICCMVLFGLWLRRLGRRSDNTFQLSDALLDPYSNKASASALVYLFLAGLGIWWAVRSGVGGGDPSNFIMALVGAFVVKAAVDRGMSAWGPRRPDMAPPPDQSDDHDDGRRDDHDRDSMHMPDVSIQAPAQIQTTTTVTPLPPITEKS
jgi:hypothetical protein